MTRGATSFDVAPRVISGARTLAIGKKAMLAMETRRGTIRRRIPPTSMNFSAILQDLNGGTLYVAGEWVVRIAALFLRAATSPPAKRDARLASAHFLPAVAETRWFAGGTVTAHRV